MPRLSVVITAVLVILVLLAVALMTRFSEAFGRERSVNFMPGLTVSTSTPKTVCLIVECTRPDGTTEQLAWANLGNARSQSLVPITLPPSGTLTVRWAVGKQIAFQTAAGLGPVYSSGMPIVVGGVVQPGQSVTFFEDPLVPNSVVGATTLAITGGEFGLRIDARSCKVVFSSPPPPAGAVTSAGPGDPLVAPAPPPPPQAEPAADQTSPTPAPK